MCSCFAYLLVAVPWPNSCWILIHKYSNIQIHKYTNIQRHKYTLNKYKQMHVGCCSEPNHFQPWPNSCWIGSCFIIYLEEKILLYLAWSCILTSLFFDWLSNCFSVYLSEGERVNERGTCKKRPWPTFPRHCICFSLSKWSTGKVKGAPKCQKWMFGGNQRRNCQSKIQNLISFHKWDSLIFWKRGQQQIHISGKYWNLQKSEIYKIRI